MRLKSILFLFFGLCLLSACQNGGEHKFSVIGAIANAPSQQVMLEELGANDVITVIDSTQTNATGNFELSGKAPEPGLYRVHFQQNKFILLTLDKGNIRVSGDWNALENYKVTGSPASENLKQFIASLRGHLRDFNTMSVVLDTLQAQGKDSLVTVAKADFADMRQKFTQFVEHYADTTSYLPNAVFAARILNPSTEKPFLSAFNQSIDRRFPNTRMARDFNDYYSKITGQPRQIQAVGTGTEIGGMAPDINLTAPDGKKVALSSLKGKYVLLDFWASWCGPCRGENPNVVAAYNKYKDKNFTVYSVSLDSKKDAWESAIKADGLSWPTHVSDLKGWESDAARLYSIQSIPSNFLIDPSGKIIARDLRGDMLEEQLQAALK